MKYVYGKIFEVCLEDEKINNMAERLLKKDQKIILLKGLENAFDIVAQSRAFRFQVFNQESKEAELFLKRGLVKPTGYLLKITSASKEQRRRITKTIWDAPLKIRLFHPSLASSGSV